MILTDKPYSFEGNTERFDNLQSRFAVVVVFFLCGSKKKEVRNKLFKNEKENKVLITIIVIHIISFILSLFGIIRI